MPYCYSKLTDPPIANPIPLIPTKTIADAVFNVETINRFEAEGRCGPAAAASARQGQAQWIEAYINGTVEADVRAALRYYRENPPALGLTVEGGLPKLPGAEVIMPEPPPKPSNPWNGDKDRS
jgi:hypothetical protein